MYGFYTVMSKSHLCLQTLEFVRMTSFGLIAHLLASPLKGAIHLLGEIHTGDVSN